MDHDEIRKLLVWYTKQARPFLEEHAADQLASLDAHGRRIDEFTDQPDLDQAAVCFLGAVGVGKSTLLNALVSERYNVLPQGGIGSLTAQATLVRFAEVPFLRASYFSPQRLRGILLALERFHERTQRREAAGSEDLVQSLSADDLKDVEAALPPANATDAEGIGDKLEAYQRQLRLMVQENQLGPIDLPYLMDAMRSALGLRSRWGRSVVPEDNVRVKMLRSCLQAAAREGVHREIFVTESGSNFEAFLDELRTHASGFLAPLIKRLEVGWNADALRDGLVLVDLPGVGVANDEYRRVTQEWIRSARAIVLVVDRGGVTEASAELLRTTGFLNRLLHDADDPASNPVMLAIAVVKVDLTADDAWSYDRNLHPGNARKWNAHFSDACQRAIAMVQAQMQQELKKLATDGAEAIQADREAALDRVLQTMQVHPVSAPQYRRFHLQDEEDRARINSADESCIPQFVTALRGLAQDQKRRRAERLSAIVGEFREHIRSALALVRAQWEADERAQREIDELRAELETFLTPRRRELEARQGGFREFLRNGIPTEIEARVGEAAHLAQSAISKYLRGLSNFHWATLRATVRRGGAFLSSSGRHLDLPNELTLRFEEPVALAWSKHTLSSLRKRTSDLGDDYVKLVGEVVEWAHQQQTRVQPTFVEALQASLIADTKGLSSVGKEAVDELKKKVRSELYNKLEREVRKQCEDFVQRRQDQGAGVKHRILEMYADLAERITAVAKPVAIKVLRDNYQEVEEEIAQLLGSYKNPLEHARNALMRSHEDSIRKSTAQKRRQVLDSVKGILKSMPKE
jgi:predicted GTPase